MLKGRKARLSENMRKVLNAVEVGETVKAREVAERTGLHPNAVSGVFFVLERQGYASKKKIRKVIDWTLTDIPPRIRGINVETN